MTPDLYLGIKLSAHLQKALDETNPHLLALFTGGGEYLDTFTAQGATCLGKKVPSFPSLEEIETLEAHLISMMQRLTPYYSFEIDPPHLLCQMNPL